MIPEKITNNKILKNNLEQQKERNEVNNSFIENNQQKKNKLGDNALYKFISNRRR